MGAYGEHSSRLRNFEGFKLVTNLKETKEANDKITALFGTLHIARTILLWDYVTCYKLSYIDQYSVQSHTQTVNQKSRDF